MNNKIKKEDVILEIKYKEGISIERQRTEILQTFGRWMADTCSTAEAASARSAAVPVPVNKIRLRVSNRAVQTPNREVEEAAEEAISKYTILEVKPVEGVSAREQNTEIQQTFGRWISDTCEANTIIPYRLKLVQEVTQDREEPTRKYILEKGFSLNGNSSC